MICIPAGTISNQIWAEDTQEWIHCDKDFQVQGKFLPYGHQFLSWLPMFGLELIDKWLQIIWPL